MTTRIALTRTLDQPPSDTPWGPSQGWEQIADGIWTTSTASHGGVWLAQWRRQTVQDKLPAWFAARRPDRGSAWYEEDCEWSVPAILFDQDWRAESVQAAINTIRMMHDVCSRNAQPSEGDSPELVHNRACWVRCAAEWKCLVDWLDGPEGQQMQARTHKRLAESHAAAKLLGDQTPA